MSSLNGSESNQNSIPINVNIDMNGNINTIENQIVKTILYVIVMPEESSALLDSDKFVKDESISGEFSNILESYVVYKESNLNSTNGNGNGLENGSSLNGGNDDKTKIIIIRPTIDPINNTSLFGTEISFFLAYTGIKHYKPDVVISMGYAGDTGLDHETKLNHGSVVIAKEKSTYHRREMIIKFFEKTSEGHYPVLTCDKLCNHLGFISAHVGTSNSFMKHDNVAIAKNIKVVEMELCSVARACAYFKVPCIGVKIISDSGADIVDEKERERQFIESLTILRKKFYETYDLVNNYLVLKKINEL